MSAFAHSFGAMHKAARRAFGGIDDVSGAGRPLKLWWAEDETGPIRAAPRYHWPIDAFSGQSRESSHPAAGMVVLPSGMKTFSAALADFPRAARPREGMCFFAGVSEDDRMFYRISRVAVLGNIVEFDASEEP